MRRADNFTTFHVPIILKSGCLKLLETCGSVQACNEIALLFFFTINEKRPYFKIACYYIKGRSRSYNDKYFEKIRGLLLSWELAL